MVELRGNRYFSLTGNIVNMMAQTEDSGDDYYPFIRKSFALLYLLVNSPHPL